MEAKVDEVTNSLIYEHLNKFDKNLASVFKKSKQFVSTHSQIDLLF